MFLFVSVSMCVCVYVCICGHMLEENKRGIGSSGARVKGGCELLTCVIETRLRFPEKTILALNL